MAIEFNCPYCTAAIRVPDEFSGKRGSCPKCATKLLVPDVVPKDPASAPEPGAEASAPAVPDVAPPVPVDASSMPPVLPTPQDATPSVARSLRKKRRRGKSTTAAGMIIPAICFLAFLGVLSLVFLLRVPELKGTLTGNLASDMSVPTVNVPLSELLLTAPEQEEASLAFRGQSESFTSVQMTCSVELNGSALAIDLEAGKDFSWYTVNPTTDLVLGDWIRQNVKTLDTVRLKTASEAGAALCRDKIKRASGTPVELAAEYYRDNFGLNYHAKAFGFAVEAIAGKRRSFCAHEDNNGTLYFILPTGTTEFLLRGRSVSGGAALFPGEYRVVVGGGKVSEAPDDTVESETVEEEPAVEAMEEPSDEEPLSEPDAEMSGGTPMTMSE